MLLGKKLILVVCVLTFRNLDGYNRVPVHSVIKLNTGTGTVYPNNKVVIAENLLEVTFLANTVCVLTWNKSTKSKGYFTSLLYIINMSF